MASLAESVISGANQAVAENGTNTMMKEGMNAFKFAQDVQTQRQELNVKKDALEVQKAQNFISSIDTALKLPSTAQKYALEGLEKRAGMLGVDPTIFKMLREDSETRQIFAQEASFLLSHGEITPELAKQLNAAGINPEALVKLAYDSHHIRMQAQAQENALKGQFMRQDRAQAFTEQQTEKAQKLAQEKEIRGDAEKYSDKAEKSGLPELVKSVTEVDKLVGGLDKFTKGTQLEGVGGVQSITPDFLKSDKGKQLNQAAQSVKNAILKARSGGAVSADESNRLLSEIGMGEGMSGLLQFRTSDQFITGMKSVRETLRAKIANMQAGAGPDAVNLYKKQYQGGAAPTLDNPLFQGGQSKPKTIIQNGHTYTLNPQTGKYE